MLKKCANPKCARPLHYLREGRIYVFQAEVSSSERVVRRVEHYWLCGECSRTLRLEKTKEGVQLMPKRSFPRRDTLGLFPQQLAS